MKFFIIKYYKPHSSLFLPNLSSISYNFFLKSVGNNATNDKPINVSKAFKNYIILYLITC